MVRHHFSISFHVIVLIFFLTGCALRPGSVKKLEREKVELVRQHKNEMVDSIQSGNSVQAMYLGCGGILLVRNHAGILIDPFFSNPSFGRIGRSLFFGKQGKKTLSPDRGMIRTGLAAIETTLKDDSIRVQGILVAHSHYDHLMDVPAVYDQLGRDLPVLLSRTGYNICHALVDSSDIIILESNMTTQRELSHPVILRYDDSLAIHVYPIRADHNPHFKHIKFFSGDQTQPVKDLTDPYQKTTANLWLEGNTFSFLIDFVNGQDQVDYRVFVQSSSCNPPAGIPPDILNVRKVDLAFLGVVSYHFSPGYPCAQLEALSPDRVIWVHWEDFFRKYNKRPKTVRGTDISGFFKLPCVENYKNPGKLMWPRTKIRFVY